MSCQFDEMLLYEYIDQILETEEKLIVERHLSACPHCRKKLSEIKLLYYELDTIDLVEVPDEVHDIRANVVSAAFQDQKVSAVEQIRRTKKKLENTPVVGALVPTKAKVKGAAKNLYSGSKKVYQALPKKEQKKKTRKLKKKSLGGLL